MKKFLSLAILAVAVFASTQLSAQKFSGLDTSPADITAFPTKGADKLAKLVYSRPQLKGRSLSTLAPAGKVWRTGANEAVEISFYKDVDFGGEKVKAGTYALFTIPGDKEWTIILNSKLNQWGAYTFDETANVAKVKGTVSSDSTSLEAFSMAFDKNGNLHMGWDTTRVEVAIKSVM